MKCAEIVSEDHVIIRRALNILDLMIRTMEAGDRIEIPDASTVLRFLQSFGDEYHQNMEEKILFPALLQAVPEEGSLQRLVLEHGDERELVTWVHRALKDKRGMEFVRISRQLGQLLANHLEKEEAVLRGISELALTVEVDTAVAAELSKNRPGPETYPNFLRLEQKYMPKPLAQPMGAGLRAAQTSL